MVPPENTQFWVSEIFYKASAV